MGNNRISILVALDGADEGLKRAIASAERSLGELVASAKSAGEKAAAGLAQVKACVSVISDGHHRQDTTARFPLDQLGSRQDPGDRSGRRRVEHIGRVGRKRFKAQIAELMRGAMPTS
ncbi:hypothetical protein [Ralstonia pseudosolanacearum]|uniref:Uncharacterized protein n=1 Tax=Ralstonia solanacearum TaxID=305 RepID=A0A0S4V619_RALSL|nr:protein of unknown function [Ralstonia solanacearum]BEU45996.1 hypothetical protein MAFF211519_13210 [Ralstonia pseudosolanacearum]BCL92912.1 hypothetical protein MAFF211479_26130 [Ralstonia solanacearum]BCM03252.1 hypothetical protein MAFF301560_26390 [Ralstonia solanacearum]BCM12020.1 hypothetical protein MAFF241648_12100 [Ralstonia solanacearum]